LNNQNEFVITPENTKSGLLQVVKNTGLQGRWQQLNTSPKVICDTHNKNGLEIVIKQIEKKNLKFYVVLGVVNDKDLNEILPLFPKNTLLFLQTKYSSWTRSSQLQQKLQHST
jgi:dihydrofolate synthase/folylpolyglutamate synthase